MIVDETRIAFDDAIRQEHKVTLISGSDEAGRGAMAGPIVVASVILPADYANPAINDSKLIPSKLREQLFTEIVAVALDYQIKIYDNLFVDQYNPKQTSRIGMQESIAMLQPQPELCLLDAEKIVCDLPTLPLIKGDAKSQSIAAASILAKVTRDRIMIELGKEYPEYGFEQHKGYCTKKHTENVSKFGVLACHRVTYKPIKCIMEGK